jgi:DNA-binding response OmpR family regulator
MTLYLAPRLLALDDLAMNLDLLCEILEPKGYTVDRACRIQSALVQMQTQSYALYLLDIQLPDGSGDALLRQRRALGDQTPAIAITGELDDEQQKALLNAGFQFAIRKPFAALQLCELVRSLAPVPSESEAAADDQARKTDAFDTYFDPAQALATTGGNLELALHLRALFRKDLPVRIIELRQAFRRPGQPALDAARHRLAGAAGFVGALALAKLLAALKAEPTEANMAAIEELVAQMLQS